MPTRHLSKPCNPHLGWALSPTPLPHYFISPHCLSSNRKLGSRPRLVPAACPQHTQPCGAEYSHRGPAPHTGLAALHCPKPWAASCWCPGTEPPQRGVHSLGPSLCVGVAENSRKYILAASLSLTESLMKAMKTCRKMQISRQESTQGPLHPCLSQATTYRA